MYSAKEAKKMPFLTHLILGIAPASEFEKIIEADLIKSLEIFLPSCYNGNEIEEI